MTLFFIIPKLNQNEEKENNTADPQCPHQHLSHCRRAGPARQSDAPTKVGVSPPGTRAVGKQLYQRLMVVFSTVVPQTSSNISPAKRKQEKKGSKKKKSTHLAPRPVRRTTTPSTLSDCWPNPSFVVRKEITSSSIQQTKRRTKSSAVILWWSVSRPWRVKAKLSRTILPLYQMVDFFLFLSFFPFFLLVVAFLFLHLGCASFSSPHRFGCCTAFFYLSGYKFLKAEVKKRTVTRCRLALEAVHASRPKLDFASP